MDLGIEGLRVLVTAGGAGIGRAIVEAFLAEGARVFTCDLDPASLETLPPAAGHIVADVADRAQVARLFDVAVPALGGLDVLVNNGRHRRGRPARSTASTPRTGTAAWKSA